MYEIHKCHQINQFCIPGWIWNEVVYRVSQRFYPKINCFTWKWIQKEFLLFHSHPIELPPSLNCFFFLSISLYLSTIAIYLHIYVFLLMFSVLSNQSMQCWFSFKVQFCNQILKTLNNILFFQCFINFYTLLVESELIQFYMTAVVRWIYNLCKFWSGLILVIYHRIVIVCTCRYSV